MGWRLPMSHPGMHVLRHGFVLTGTEVVPASTASAGGGKRRPPLPLETSMPGVFAAGEIRHGSIKGLPPRSAMVA